MKGAAGRGAVEVRLVRDKQIIVLQRVMVDIHVVMTPASTANIAFQSPAFRRFQVVRVLGIWASRCKPWPLAGRSTDLTNRPLDLGMVGLVQFIPAMLLWPVTGAVVDRFDCRIIVMATLLGYVITAGLLATLATVGVTSVWPIYGTLLLLAVARSFSAPAHQALLPRLVPREHFPNAVTWSSSLFQLSAIAGPAIGGAVYAITGERAACTSSRWCSARGGRRAHHGAPAEAALSRERPSWSQVFEGVRYIRDRPIILGAISLDLFAVLFGGAALLPIFAKDILAVGPAGLGIRARPQRWAPPRWPSASPSAPSAAGPASSSSPAWPSSGSPRSRSAPPRRSGCPSPRSWWWVRATR